MMAGFWTSVVAVLGTLFGGLLGGAVQARTARAARRDSTREQRRAEMVSAVTSLAVALTDHRRATWVAEVEQLSGAGEQARADAVAASHETWSAVTGPLVTVKVLAPQFTAAAEEVTDAIWEMLDAPDVDALQARRAEAGAAQDRLLAVASEYFAQGGV